MHVIRERATNRILFIDYQTTPGPKLGSEVFPQFDPDTMEVGWTDQTYIPAYFDIDSNGKIVELTLAQAVVAGLTQPPATHKLVGDQLIEKTEDELIAEGLINLGELKRLLLDNFDKAAFAIRSTLVPDYKLQNAALGVYGEERLAVYKATIQAFRDEYHRLEQEVEKAGTAAELRVIQPNFPGSLVEPQKSPGQDAPGNIQ